MQSTPITAAVLVIGDEILSGRTQDTNTHYIANYLNQIGVDLREVRVVADDEAEIIAAVNALRQRYHYLLQQAVLDQPMMILRQTLWRALLALRLKRTLGR